MGCPFCVSREVKGNGIHAGIESERKCYLAQTGLVLKAAHDKDPGTAP